MALEEGEDVYDEKFDLHLVVGELAYVRSLMC